MAERVKNLKSRGVDVIDLSWGEPDFPTPQHITTAATQAMKDGFTKYTQSMGIPELRIAISKKLERENNLLYSPEEILITPGCKQAILYALLVFIDPDDEILIPEPCWLSYADQISVAGGKFVPIPSSEKQKFKVSREEILNRITDKTKIILINNPTNPTGVFWEREDLEIIAEIAKEKDLIVISDEIYEKILFDKKQYLSIASLPDMKSRTIVINGFSKSYCMTGFRIGYAASTPMIIKEMLKIHQHSATCASSISQVAAIAALRGDQSFVDTMVKQYEDRRNVFVEEINKIPGLSCIKPDGTFYAFVNIKNMGMSSIDAANYFLERYGVATVPGSAYGKSGEGYLRFSLTQHKDKLVETLNRIKKG
jgi:aspartate/methionine/tyrosine aminotransferase